MVKTHVLTWAVISILWLTISITITNIAFQKRLDAMQANMDTLYRNTVILNDKLNQLHEDQNSFQFEIVPQSLHTQIN